MLDNHGRSIEYLRLSLTDACNFKCLYCLPNGSPTPQFSYLSRLEIKYLLKALTKIGLQKVRLTGGEPGLRPDLLHIVHDISGINGINTIALTTNGTALHSKNLGQQEHIAQLHACGVTALNISVDSLNNDTFTNITRSNTLPQILLSIQHALDIPSLDVKINCVLLKDFNFNEMNAWFDFVAHKKISVRFIELMPTCGAVNLYKQNFVSSETVLQLLKQNGWNLKKSKPLAGPAQEFSHPNFMGSIGVISPLSHPFCSTCNRIRITAQGIIYPCAFSNTSFPLRHLLQSPLQEMELIAAIKQALTHKSQAHNLNTELQHNNSFSVLGG